MKRVHEFDGGGDMEGAGEKGEGGGDCVMF